MDSSNSIIRQDTRELYTPSTAKPSGVSEEVTNLGAGFLFLGIILAIVIFVLWIWSMISMISLNVRFKKFYDDYQAVEFVTEKEMDQEPTVHRELSVEPLDKELLKKQSISWSEKHKFLIVSLSVSLLLFVAVMLYITLAL